MTGPAVDARPTFFAHALALSALHGTGPWPDDGRPYPDEPPGGEQALMPSVVLDSVRAKHFGIGQDSDAVAGLARRIADLAVPGLDLTTGLDTDFGAAQELHDWLAGGGADALRTADRIGPALKERGVRRGPVGAIGRWLAETGTHRAAVKTGIVLVGLAGDTRDRELLLLLGSLDEFTLYAAVALRRTLDEPDQALHALARSVTGWGRIHAVERLQGTQDPAIKGWLLRDGFRNGVMNEYLAPLAATTGGLLDALLEPADRIDEALLEGAGDILATLADGEGGPTTGLREYPDAVPALGRYAELAATAPRTLTRLGALLSIERYVRLAAPDGDWEPAAVTELARGYAALLALPGWDELVLTHLSDPVRPDFGLGIWVAGRRGLRPVRQILDHLEHEPLDAHAWHHLLRDARPADLPPILAAAERLLPLAELANGPGDDLGLGRDRIADRVLEPIVQSLAHHPGHGWPVLRAALLNRVTRNRRAARRALRSWPPGSLPPEAVELLAAPDCVPEPEPKPEGQQE